VRVTTGRAAEPVGLSPVVLTGLRAGGTVPAMCHDPHVPPPAAGSSEASISRRELLATAGAGAASLLFDRRDAVAQGGGAA